ncbi:MAG: TonB-dependent receptor [Bacteroidales bacterium]|nr:TonB-dependent receptor [Bacteroidales bacterium]
MKRQLSVLFSLLIAIPVLCQSVTDTVQIDIVPIYAQPSFFNDGAKRVEFDSLTLQTTLSSSLSDLLSHSTALILKNYGTEGMSSSVSLRGGGATRTQISWEGFPLNANSNGENNISQIPVSGFSTIAIDHSASATQFGNGTFGGAIELKNKPVWRKQVKASCLLSAASFDTYKTNVGYTIGNKNIQYSGSIFYTTSESDFEYYDYVRLENERRKNAEFTQWGTIQNLHIKLSEHIFAHGALWYQVNKSNLPALLGSDPNNAEKQTDSLFRAVASLQMIYPKTRVIYKTMYINDYELYTKKITPSAELYTTYSEIANISNMHSLQLRQRLCKTLSFSAEAQGKIAKANVGDYGGEKRENSIAGIAAIQYKQSDFASSFSIRKEWNSQYIIPYIVNIGADYALLHKKLIIRATAGNKYRTPTFNDLYWVAWGNPDLKPEHGFSAESGFTYKIIAKDSTELTTDFTIFHATINDMIMWTQQGAVWHPNNTAQAVLQGIELNANFNKTFNKFTIRNNFAINLNTSHITKMYDADDSDNIGHQLYYVPKFELAYRPQIEIWNTNLSLHFHYESKRYYALEKNLNAYFLADLGIQHTIHFQKTKLVIGGKINNITNTVYEQIRSYPLPKRNYEISIQIFIN